MPRLRFAPLALALLAIPWVLQAQTPQPPAEAKPQAKPATLPSSPDPEAALALDKKIIATGKENSEVMKNLTYLSDVIGARLTGSTNMRRANEWTAEVMKSYGLTNIRMEPWTIPIGWERGTVTARIVEPDNNRYLDMASAAWAPGTKGKVVGDVVIIRSQSKEELAKFKGKLKNAIILQSPPRTPFPVTALANAPGQPQGGERGGRGGRGGQPDRGGQPLNRGDQPPNRGDQLPMPPGGGFPRGGRGPSTEVNEFLRAEGAAAVLSEVAFPHGLLQTGGGWRGGERANAGEVLPSLRVTHESYAQLWRLASRPAPARTRVELEVVNKFIPGPVTVYNTVGEIRGSEKPDEFIVLGAHLDSWGLGQGTTDNGTGSCAVLEAARIIMSSGIRPKRTIRFVLFTGEEQGLVGSRNFVSAHQHEMPKTSIAIIHDTGTGKVVGIGTQRRPGLKPIFEKELVSLKELGVNDINDRGIQGSDHQSFDSVGVPGICLQQDPAEYRLTHHSQTDTLDKAREPDLVQGSQVMALMAVRFANLDGLLPHHAASGGRRGGGN